MYMLKHNIWTTPTSLFPAGDVETTSSDFVPLGAPGVPSRHAESHHMSVEVDELTLKAQQRLTARCVRGFSGCSRSSVAATCCPNEPRTVTHDPTKNGLVGENDLLKHFFYLETHLCRL